MGNMTLNSRFNLYHDIRPKDCSVESTAGIETEKSDMYKRRSSAQRENFTSSSFLNIPEM